MIQKLYKELNNSNDNLQPELQNNYKFYVGGGNNSSSVAQTIKKRSWWHKVKIDKFCNSDEDGAQFIWTAWKKSEICEALQHSEVKLIYNRLENNFHLSNKKALFLNMTNYYKKLKLNPLVAIPITFHIKSIKTDPEFFKFVQFF